MSKGTFSVVPTHIFIFGLVPAGVSKYVILQINYYLLTIMRKILKFQYKTDISLVCTILFYL